MKNIKRAAILLTAGGLLCSAVSCSNKSASIQIVEETEEQPEYLSFFSGVGYADSDIEKYWSDRFARQYNQKVYVNQEGASYYADEGLSYRELLEKRQSSSSPDDLYIINAEDVLDFEKKGYWMDLSDMEFTDNLSKEALYQSTYNGKVFSVPLSFTGFGFCWNNTMLKEHGLTVPSNLQEFLAVCEKLRAEGILPYGANKGYALTVPAMCKGLADIYKSDDKEQKIKELNSGTVPISQYMKEGFEFLSMMIEKGYLNPEQALESQPRKEDVELFSNGECAFICIELSAVRKLPEDTGFEIQYGGLPILEEGDIAVYGANSRLCVNPNSKQLDTALKFIEMVGTTEALDESAKQEYVMSSAKNSKLTVHPVQEEMSNLLKQPGQIPNQDFALHFNTWENIRDVGRELCNGISVDEACVKLDEMQSIELARYAE